MLPPPTCALRWFGRNNGCRRGTHDRTELARSSPDRKGCQALRRPPPSETTRILLAGPAIISWSTNSSPISSAAGPKGSPRHQGPTRRPVRPRPTRPTNTSPAFLRAFGMDVTVLVARAGVAALTRSPASSRDVVMRRIRGRHSGSAARRRAKSSATVSGRRAPARCGPGRVPRFRRRCRWPRRRRR